MPKWKTRIKYSYLPVIGTMCILLLALALLWHGNANSMQATPAMVAGVYFDVSIGLPMGGGRKSKKESTFLLPKEM